MDRHTGVEISELKTELRKLRELPYSEIRENMKEKVKEMRA